jgi:hypothetical protein
MRISGVSSPESSRPKASGGIGRSVGRERHRRMRAAYALAVTWVVTGSALYTFQMLKLVGILG